MHAQNGETPLIQTSYKGHVESAMLLVEHGADLNIKEKVACVKIRMFFDLFIQCMEFLQK
jgi:hypothetical protein